MGWEAWLTLGVMGLVFACLIFTRLATDIVLIGGLAILILSGVISVKDGLKGFSNEGMITVGILFVVGAGVRQTGGVDWVVQRLFGRPKTAVSAIVRLMVPTATISAFMNNTPLVAMLIPAVSDWARQSRISAAKLMIPLSYAAILGGTCTLIGTSTNLVVNGQVRELAENEIKAAVAKGIPEAEARRAFESKTGLPSKGLGLFEISWVGVPAAIIGVLFVAIASRWLLPDRRPAISQQDDPREYTAEMLVAPESPLVGKTIEEAGLRHLPGAFLAEIDRGGIVLPAVSPEERLWANDRLVFVGIVASVVDLQKIRGLIPATDQVFKLTAPRSTRCLIEAVVSNTCPLVGRTIRDGRFRSNYNAVVVAVARNGERLHQKIGDIVVKPGDTLLLEAHPSFADQQRNSRDFFLVSRLEDSNPPGHERAIYSGLILLGMVLAVSLGPTICGWLGIDARFQPDMLKASLVAAGLMIAARCCTATIARRSIDWEVLLAIAASFGIGEALEKSRAASSIANMLVDIAGDSRWGALAAIYLVTLIVTELITNNAAAALMFPFAIATARQLDSNAMPFVIAVMMAASAGFATPIGYQTNLMVYGPGGYRFGDYVRIGVPLDILVGVVTVGIAPFVWPF